MTNPLRKRQNVADLHNNHSTLLAYAEAVRLMKNLSVDNPNHPQGWKAQALLHQSHCPHNNWYFLPWHRAYLIAFENLCGELIGDHEFALPYWNWSQTKSIPEPFWQGPLLDTTRVRKQNEELSDVVIDPSEVEKILLISDFELFGSSKPKLQNDTRAFWQRTDGVTGALEGGPHNKVHKWIGGNMSSRNMIAPLDPIFWLHHCNIDRLWAKWNACGNPNSANKLWTDFKIHNNFLNPDSTPYNVRVGDLQSISTLGYIYDRFDTLTPAIALDSLEKRPAPLDPLFERVLEKFSATKTKLGRLELEFSFSMDQLHTVISSVKDSSPNQKNLEGQRQLLALIRNVTSPLAIQGAVNIFLNCPYLSSVTPGSDPHYVGSFGFLDAQSHHHSDGHPPDNNITRDYVFDLTNTVVNLEMKSQFIIQLILVPFDKQPMDGIEISIRSVEILLI